MPTASTAQILGNNESFEPYTQNLYVRRVLSGEFVQAQMAQMAKKRQKGGENLGKNGRFFHRSWVVVFFSRFGWFFVDIVKNF